MKKRPTKAMLHRQSLINDLTMLAQRQLVGGLFSEYLLTVKLIYLNYINMIRDIGELHKP